MPAARQIQPIGFWGRLEAIKAPTRGKGRKGTRKMNTALLPPVPQVLGGCTDRVRIYNTTLAAHRTSESAASDQDNKKATRALPYPWTCCLAASITTPLYSTSVFQSLRQTLRSRTLRQAGRRSRRGIRRDDGHTK